MCRGWQPFFVEDLRWTVRNYDNFSGRKEEFARWWGSVESLREATDLSLETIDDCIRCVALLATLALLPVVLAPASRVRAALDGVDGWLSQRHRVGPEEAR